MHMLCPCWGGLLNLALTHKSHAWMCPGSHPESSRHQVQRCFCCRGRAGYNLVVVRLRLLDQNHVERSHHVACNCASLWSRVSAQNCEALLVTQLAAALVADDLLGWQTTLRLRGNVSLAPNPRLADPCFFDHGGPAGPGGATKGFPSSTSVSSDSQGSVGVFNESLSLGTVLQSSKYFFVFLCTFSAPWLHPCFSPAIPFLPLRHPVNCVLNCVNFHACRVQKAERISTQKNEAGTDQKPAIATCCETKKNLDFKTTFGNPRRKNRGCGLAKKTCVHTEL